MSNEIENIPNNEMENKTDLKLHLIRKCSNCALVRDVPEDQKKNKCPFYNPDVNHDYCVLDKTDRGIQTPQKLRDQINSLIEMSYKNIEGLKQNLTSSGLSFSKDLSDALKDHFDLLQKFKSLLSDENSVTISAKGSQASKGILSEIFAAKRGGNS